MVYLSGGLNGSRRALPAESVLANPRSRGCSEHWECTGWHADDVAREVVEPGTPALKKIAEHFGQEILLPGGGLDRAALRRIVFDAPEETHLAGGAVAPGDP